MNLFRRNWIKEPTRTYCFFAFFYCILFTALVVVIVQLIHFKMMANKWRQLNDINRLQLKSYYILFSFLFLSSFLNNWYKRVICIYDFLSFHKIVLEIAVGNALLSLNNYCHVNTQLNLHYTGDYHIFFIHIPFII